MAAPIPILTQWPPGRKIKTVANPRAAVASRATIS